MPCVSVGGNGINHGEVTQVVTRDTRWPAGTPCWVDVSVDDVPKAIAFYQALFGWDIELGGPEVGGYSIAHSGGRIVAASAPRWPDPDAPPPGRRSWPPTTSTRPPAKIKGAGGQVLAGPMDVMEEGRMAVAMDPAGAAFALWQGGNTTGLSVANEPGSLTWNEHLAGTSTAARPSTRPCSATATRT